MGTRRIVGLPGFGGGQGSTLMVGRVRKGAALSPHWIVVHVPHMPDEKTKHRSFIAVGFSLWLWVVLGIVFALGLYWSW